MTITLQAVNDLIASLESEGELSIRAQKFLKLAKVFKQLAAENVQIKAMNDCLSEELRGYESDGAFEGPKMHLLWWQVETPATDRIVAGIKADGVEEMASTYRGFANKDGCSVNMKCSYNLTAERAESYAAYIRHQLREGADK
ncbi:hypothetical protein [Klebsiella pneumoniae]|uniref:hypothetical protein n=1 Tax=Klebsiella pneumoniae TaxID=573 RepID=UPI000B956E0F|nr:hypothetical protein [Klebsiella pneumoniae]MCQ8322383.1 hypothetical protein [Klebsiella pneumoniae]OYM09552.1 hypothetical protein CI755_07140 [Klebsiella pneumoniae subsp. pneumoniae]HBR2411215.1 hypothetical protein [Klebsiella pneumoniae]HBR2430618.1 hypothetical protein [Klebsiella pneumoniae]HBU1528830.1 hypothetical protein [Klebsiella pneumoniae]